MYKGQQSDLDLRPCDLKINREQLLSKGIHYTTFSNFQTKGSKDIAMSRNHLGDRSTEQPTDRCKTSLH